MDINAIYPTIKSYVRGGHELGQAISEAEADALVQQLIQRLGTTNRKLDMSVRSLEKLEGLLITYLGSLGRDTPDLGSEEAVRFLREVAAYIGKTFVAHSPGQWQAEDNLYGTSIVYYFTTMGEPLDSHRYLYFPLWNMAEFCLMRRCCSHQRIHDPHWGRLPVG